MEFPGHRIEWENPNRGWWSCSKAKVATLFWNKVPEKIKFYRETFGNLQRGSFGSLIE